MKPARRRQRRSGAAPDGPNWSSPAGSSDEQRQVAEDTIVDADASGLWHGKVVTKISEARPFWEAGAEDQDYLHHYPDGKNQFSP